MCHQRSIVHHFIPLIVQVLEKSFITKCCSISENQHKTALENINLTHTKYLRVIKCQIYIFFPLHVQVLEKRFLTKSCSISENKHKTTLENIKFAHITYI